MDRLGLGCEIAGFIAMFLFFPWGTIAGVPLLYVGWRKSTVFRCSNCGTSVKKDAEKCPRCRSRFSSDD
jgi:hypothetical protein